VNRDELIKDFIENGMSKEAAEKAADKYLSKHQEVVSGLEKNRDEILQEKRSIKEQLTKFKDVDPEKYSEAMKKLKKIEEDELLSEKKYDEALAVKTKEWETANQKLSEQLQAAQKELDSIIMDRDLVGGLAKTGIKKDLIEFVQKTLASEAKVVEVDGKKQVVIKDMPVDKYLEDWTKSETAKHFIEAPTNGGAGKSGNPSPNAGGEGGEVSTEEFYKQKWNN